MSDLSMPLKDVEWVKTRVLQLSDAGPIEDHTYKYEVMLPDYLASWDVFAVWERQRFLSMDANLKKGDILFDIGAESGWQSAIYAQFVGGENMVLFEPTPQYWVNIRAIWDANNLPDPAGCFDGFASNRTELRGGVAPLDWPESSKSDQLWTGLTYQYIHEMGHVTLQIKIDDYVKRTGTLPSALTMDCEGAELVILQGASDVLLTLKPLVWVAIHPDMMLQNYDQTTEELFSFMEDKGYDAKFLGEDHEEHWVFFPKGYKLNG